MRGQNIDFFARVIYNIILENYLIKIFSSYRIERNTRMKERIEQLSAGFREALGTASSADALEALRIEIGRAHV